MKELIYKGIIRDDELGENYSTIYIGDTAIVPELDDEILDKQVTVSYYIANEEMTEQELLEANIRSISGGIDTEYYASYSDYTGYLWTNQEIKIGGHDLLEELYDNIGKYIQLKVIVHGTISS